MKLTNNSVLEKLSDVPLIVITDNLLLNSLIVVHNVNPFKFQKVKLLDFGRGKGLVLRISTYC